MIGKEVEKHLGLHLQTQSKVIGKEAKKQSWKKKTHYLILVVK